MGNDQRLKMAIDENLKDPPAVDWDREKLKALAETIDALQMPTVTTRKAKIVMDETSAYLLKITTFLNNY